MQLEHLPSVNSLYTEFHFLPPLVVHSIYMNLEHLPSVNLASHDLKLQHSSSDIMGIEEPFRLK